MPELPVKEIRLSELHLPEVTRDDIVRALSDIHLPETRFPRIEPGAPRRPTMSLPHVDVSGILAGAMAVGRYGRPMARRVRWPVALGVLAVVATVGVAVLRSPAVRERADRAARTARERVEAFREAQAATDDVISPKATGSPIDPATSDVAAVIHSTEDERPTSAVPA